MTTVALVTLTPVVQTTQVTPKPEKPIDGKPRSFSEELGKVKQDADSNKAEKQPPESTEKADSQNPVEGKTPDSEPSTQNVDPKISSKNAPAVEVDRVELITSEVIASDETLVIEDSFEAAELPVDVLQANELLQNLPVVTSITPGPALVDIKSIASSFEALSHSVESKNHESSPLATSIIASIHMGKAMDKPVGKTDSSLQQPIANVDIEQIVDGDSKFSSAISAPKLQPDSAAPQVTRSDLKASEVSPQTAAASASPVIEKTAGLKPTDQSMRQDFSSFSVQQGGPVNTASPSSSATAPSIQSPVGSPDWSKHLGQQLVSFHMRGDQNIQLHLNPANLGPMSISLNVNEHQQLIAHFASHSSQVRIAIEQGLPQLREAMAEQGISLGQASVGEQRQQQFGQESSENKPRSLKDNPTETIAEAELSAADRQERSVSDGQISTYA